MRLDSAIWPYRHDTMHCGAMCGYPFVSAERKEEKKISYRHCRDTVFFPLVSYAFFFSSHFCSGYVLNAYSCSCLRDYDLLPLPRDATFNAHNLTQASVAVCVRVCVCVCISTPDAMRCDVYLLLQFDLFLSWIWRWILSCCTAHFVGNEKFGNIWCSVSSRFLMICPNGLLAATTVSKSTKNLQ